MLGCHVQQPALPSRSLLNRYHLSPTTCPGGDWLLVPGGDWSLFIVRPLSHFARASFRRGSCRETARSGSSSSLRATSGCSRLSSLRYASMCAAIFFSLLRPGSQIRCTSGSVSSQAVIDIDTLDGRGGREHTNQLTSA